MLVTSSGEQVAVNADGRIDFAASMAPLGQLAVSVASQPVKPSQTCTAALDASGRVEVECAVNRFAVGGSVTVSAHMGYAPMVTRPLHTCSNTWVRSPQRTVRPLM